VSGLESLAEAGRLAASVEIGPLTTYKVGGEARWFLEAESERDITDL